MSSSTLHSSESSARVFESIDELTASLGITPELIDQRKKAVALSSAERQSLRAFWERAQDASEAIVRRLYEKLRSTPQLASMLQQESRVERLMALQSIYLKQLFCSEIDDDYVRHRLGIGSVHHHIRLTPQWYLLTYSHFLTEYIELMFRSSMRPEELRLTIDAFQKSIFFDISFALDAYGHIEDHVLIRRRQQGDVWGNAENIDKQDLMTSRKSDTSAQKAANRMTRIRINDLEASIRANFIGLPSNSSEIFSHIRKPIESSLETILEHFYEFVRTCGPLAEIVPSDQVNRLVSQVSAYWREFLEGQFDRRHAASRMRIGVIHESIGLSPAWYVSGLCRQVSGILNAIPPQTPHLELLMTTLFRGILFDMTFIIDAYMESRAATLLEVHGFANQVMAGLSSAVVIVNRQNHILFANESFLDLVGVEPAMLYMMELTSILSQDKLIATLERKRRLGHSRESCMTQWGERIYRVTFVRLQESTEAPLHSTAIVFDDVSDVFHLSENIEMDAMQYKSLANAVTAVLWEMDWETRTIHSISHPAIDLTGHRDVHFLGRPFAWQNCIAASDKSRFEVCCAALSSSPQCVCEYRMLRADGREIWVQSHLSRMRRGAQFVIAAVSIDITRERQSDHLRLVALEDVAAGLVNVVNNALTVIHANLELEKETQHSIGDYSRQPSSFLLEAQYAAKRAAQVLGQVRSFAKGQFLRSRTISVNEVLKSAAYALQLQCGSLSRLQMRCAEELWDIRTDPDQLTLAVGQLCENAAHAMPSGGTVSIITRNVSSTELGAHETGFEGDWVEVSVVDDGIGMSDEVMRRAIEPFFSTSRSADRIGLGLSMVYGFVSQSGGSLKIRSSLGAGTTVALRFPRYMAPISSPPTALPISGLPIVLIVDNDESVRTSTAQLVNRLGHKTEIASSSATALKLAETCPISFLITDLPLHDGSDGISLARSISRLHHAAGIILMTGSGSLEQLNETVPASWVILEKPFSLSDLSLALVKPNQNDIGGESRTGVLSTREREVLQWVAAGKSQAEIAMLLHISERTVEQHVRNAKLKLNAVNTVQAVVDAISRGEISASAG